MGIGVVIFFFIMVLAITTLISLLTRGRKGNSNTAVRRLFLRPPLMGTTDPRRSGYWYTTNWYAREKVEEAIQEGQQRNAHLRKRRYAHSAKKHSRNGH
jgi:hypothetical protein